VDRRDAVCSVSSAQKLTTRTMLVATLGRRRSRSGSRVLRQPAEEDRLARQEPRENPAVDAAVQHDEHRVPVVLREEPLDRRQRAVEQFADRFAVQEARCARDRPFEGGDERRAQFGVGMLASCPPRISCSSLRCSTGGVTPAASSTCAAVARVRTSPLVMARSMLTPEPAMACPLPAPARFLAPSTARRRRVGPAVRVEIFDRTVAHQQDAAPLDVHQGTFTTLASTSASMSAARSRFRPAPRACPRPVRAPATASIHRATTARRCNLGDLAWRTTRPAPVMRCASASAASAPASHSSRPGRTPLPFGQRLAAHALGDTVDGVPRRVGARRFPVRPMAFDEFRQPRGRAKACRTCAPARRRRDGGRRRCGRRDSRRRRRSATTARRAAHRRHRARPAERSGVATGHRSSRRRGSGLAPCVAPTGAREQHAQRRQGPEQVAHLQVGMAGSPLTRFWSSTPVIAM